MGYTYVLLLWFTLWAPPATESHTWMFSKGRAWMQASTDKPFRARVTEAGAGTHVQFGPGQATVLRWAASHNNTFSLAVVSAADEAWFYHKDYYKMLDDYIDSAPDGSNEAVAKPRYHGAPGRCGYLNEATNTACAGGNCVKDLFSGELPKTHKDCTWGSCGANEIGREGGACVCGGFGDAGREGERGA